VKKESIRKIFYCRWKNFANQAFLIAKLKKQKSKTIKTRRQQNCHIPQFRFHHYRLIRHLLQIISKTL